ncbi:Metallo-dependent hydrolase [Decorospora gaudefroyi]|uniref:Metallo-dependent hydrolase n=1 Tax=Decorospora gaudefroyi TaxID=184978 RepID=A0A6A5KGX9_9PLEO|nr:Metallo-dependent hydrolase [Decorospora gaudefroyi]
MRTDSDSKTSSESQKTRSGLLAKCGFIIPTFFVRDRDGSPEDPNRPVMTVADSPKKRKRAPSPTRGIPLHTGEPKVINTASDNMTSEAELQAKVATALAVFDAALDDRRANKTYDGERERILRTEEEDAWDRESKPKSTSRSEDDRIEKCAATIIRVIREYERNVVFGNLPSEKLPGSDTLDMGGQFLTNKDRIDNESKVYEIAKMVPKGALLHLHFNAELHPERLLEQAREMENMYIRSIQPLLTQQDLDETETVFNVLDPSKVEPNVNIFSATYPGQGDNWKKEEFKWKVWMPWSEFQTKFEEQAFSEKYKQQEPTIVQEVPHSCAEPGQMSLSPAENWLKSKMVLSLDEAYGPAQTVNGVWARFNQATRCFKGLLNYEKVYKWYISKAIDRMIEEKVMYAELRPMLLDKFIPSNSGREEEQIDNAAQMRLIIDGVQAKQVELKKRDELHKFPFGLKIIYCTPRSIPIMKMRQEMKDCIKLKMQFPELICGFDLVGAEDRPFHIGYFKNELLAFRKTCEELNLDIPFMFHAGETLLDTGGSGDPQNSNLYEAVLLNSKRIGHGFSLMKHPHLVEKFKKTATSPGICIELCPISNELLHLCRNVKEHPFPELLAAGIPCTVNSDNPSLFSNSMSHEFYQIMVGAPTMSLYSWKQLARWSIDYSCLTKKEKAEGHAIFTRSWKHFCRDVVDRYSGLADELALALQPNGGNRLEIPEVKEAYRQAAERIETREIL